MSRAAVGQVGQVGGRTRRSSRPGANLRSVRRASPGDLVPCPAGRIPTLVDVPRPITHDTAEDPSR